MGAKMHAGGRMVKRNNFFCHAVLQGNLSPHFWRPIRNHQLKVKSKVLQTCLGLSLFASYSYSMLWWLVNMTDGVCSSHMSVPQLLQFHALNIDELHSVCFFSAREIKGLWATRGDLGLWGLWYYQLQEHGFGSDTGLGSDEMTVSR